MIREERSPAFWSWVCEDADVRAQALHGASIDDLCTMIQRPDFLAYAADHGGFLFRNLDGLGMVLELHTLFRREGWGREVAAAAREVTALIFSGPCTVMVTHQQRDNWRSQPPRSHGWKLCREVYSPSPIGDVRLWYLTPDLWSSAPVNRI